MNLVFMDGYDEVRDQETQKVVFSTLIPESLREDIGRHCIDPDVVDNVVSIWNKTGTASANLWSNGAVDEYLLNEGRCSQEEREIICESIYDYIFNK
jgi:hypothetical protein